MATNKPLTFEAVGNGIEIARDTDHVLVRLPASAAHIASAGPSKSGKTKIVSTTGGFADVPGPGGLRISLNMTGKL